MSSATPADDETTDDSVIADIRNFYKVELWTRDDGIERMLFAGTSLDKARAAFADYAARRATVGAPPAGQTSAPVNADQDSLGKRVLARLALHFAA